MQGQKKVNLADPQVRKRFVTYKEASELYSMGLTRIQEHAKIAGATYKMGNKVLINTDIFEVSFGKLNAACSRRLKITF